jgi:hypothetical protein
MACASPLKASVRLFQASQASLSASLRASAARSAIIRTELPYSLSRDLAPVRPTCDARIGQSKPLHFASLSWPAHKHLDRTRVAIAKAANPVTEAQSNAGTKCPFVGLISLVGRDQ